MRKPVLRITTAVFLASAWSGCQAGRVESPPAAPTRWVDDIRHDDALDSPDFALCNGDEKVFQYFNDGNGMEYAGGKPAVERAFFENYDATGLPAESGWVRIRFIVNCRGETGRFRAIGMGPDYTARAFDERITSQLIGITASLDGWETKQIRGIDVDYYQYLIFKLKEGKIDRILP